MGKLREVMPGLQAPLAVPATCCHKARQQVRRFRRGERNYIRINEKGAGYLKINIGPFWRLLSCNQGQNWELMSHERYSKAIRK
ncbi:hypothetical protein [Serratia sp. JSRIV006]|uniref:ParE family toxin-like protein n=1 Tax=Serratia sp. JSRIV006 TaxID=2831896 RepID=UPI001CC0F8F6|nr:hypothetical protein [Serratia sp. JSRIV006]UAN63365.1 hypothetical protein KGP16_01845 [Serratia sp. JSRIV006]